MKSPASSARLWLALIAVGSCLAVGAAAVTLLPWGRGPRISAVAQQPNPGTQNASRAANAPPGSIAQSPSPKADVLVANNDGPDSKVTPDQTDNPPALKKLLAKVTAISPVDVARYEKFLDEPTLLNAIGYQGSLPYTGDDVREVINLGLEKPAVAALTKLIQEKNSSTDKADLLICAQSIKALGQFGSHAREATPLLAGLQNYKDNAVGSAAKLALEDINSKPQPPTTPPSDPKPEPKAEPKFEPKGDATEHELNKLQGKWQLVGSERNGVSASEKVIRALDKSLTIKGHEVTMTIFEGRSTAKGDAVNESQSGGTLKINATSDPKDFDIPFDSGRLAQKKVTWKGIYRCEDEKLILCYDEDGSDRPKEFKTGTTTGDKVWLEIYQKR